MINWTCWNKLFYTFAYIFSYSNETQSLLFISFTISLHRYLPVDVPVRLNAHLSTLSLSQKWIYKHRPWFRWWTNVPVQYVSTYLFILPFVFVYHQNEYNKLRYQDTRTDGKKQVREVRTNAQKIQILLNIKLCIEKIDCISFIWFKSQVINEINIICWSWMLCLFWLHISTML